MSISRTHNDAPMSASDASRGDTCAIVIESHEDQRAIHPGLVGAAIDVSTYFPVFCEGVMGLGGVTNAGVSNGVKFSSALSAVTGTLQIISYTKSKELAHRIRDKAGEVFANIGIARGALSIGFGAVITGVRSLSIAGSYTASESVLTAGQNLGYAGTGLLSLVQLLSVASAGVQCIRQIRFGKALLNLRSDEEKIRFLHNQIHLTGSDRERIYAKTEKKLSTQQKRTVHSSKKQQRDKTSLLETNRRCSLLMLEDEEFIQEKVGTFSDIDGKIQPALTKALTEEILRKRALFVRHTSMQSLSLLLDYENRLNADAAISACELVKQVLQENKKSIRSHLMTITLCVISIVALVVLSVFTAGAPMFVALGILILTSCVMFVMDAQNLIAQAKSTNTSSKDRITLFVLGILSLMFTVVGGFLAVGTAAKVAALVTGLVFVGVQVGIMAWLHKKRKREIEELSQARTSSNATVVQFS